MPEQDGLFDLSGRVAVVTGGGTHIGRAITEALARYGAAVYVVGRRGEVVEKAASDLQQHGYDCRAIACDASDDAQVGACVDRVLDDHGRLDIMVCNAGAAITSQLFPDLLWDEFAATMRACVTTAVVCAQHAARAMIPRRSGRIIVIGSTHGELGSDARFYTEEFGNRAGVSYHAAKGAVINLARAAACDLAQYGITVNCISPGQCPLPDDDPVTVERFRLNTPLQRNGKPEDMQGAALLLASDAGGWITGHNLVVDGGWSAW
jgi:NAD(P)-dependent dehydrogenase (short-subunit alcohol dehydrogenase family)